MHCYESVDGLPLAAVTVRRFKLLLKRIWVKVMFYNVLSHMQYFQASSVLHWFLVKCLIASWMQYNSVLLANMVYISKWSTAPAGQIQDFSRVSATSDVTGLRPCLGLQMKDSVWMLSWKEGNFAGWARKLDTPTDRLGSASPGGCQVGRNQTRSAIAHDF